MDLHDVPMYADRWAYLYLEYGQIDRDAGAVVFHQNEREVLIPLEQVSTLLVGPGTSVTGAAMKLLAENNCLVCFTGQDGMRLYAHGTGGTHSSHRLLGQVMLWADETARMRVIRRMYGRQFGAAVSPHLSLRQLRGMEGARVRAVYEQLAAETGVAWSGRRYDQNDWNCADPLNRALSVANALLHGVCHAAILSAGYSPAVGFIHTGKMLSFVYDVADFYKSRLTAPLAFRVVRDGEEEVERRTRAACRQEFFATRLAERILPDIAEVLNAGDHLEESPGELEGRAVSLAGGDGGGGISGESLGTDPGSAMEADPGETEEGMGASGLE